MPVDRKYYTLVIYLGYIEGYFCYVRSCVMQGKTSEGIHVYACLINYGLKYLLWRIGPVCVHQPRQCSFLSEKLNSHMTIYCG